MTFIPEQPGVGADAGATSQDRPQGKAEANAAPKDSPAAGDLAAPGGTFSQLPRVIDDESQLEECLTRPRPLLADFIRSVSSPLLILGAGGKMGPTLAVLAKRAAKLAGHRLEVIAVSRFSDEASRQWLESHGVSTLSADLLARDAVQKLPDAADVIHLVGMKFGTRENPALTWAVNTLAPAHLAERYEKARLVALSTGNVYPLVSIHSGGAREEHLLNPLGEYANAAIARERIFEYFGRKNGTPIALIRLTYAVELRYGVLVDIARKVYAGEAIDLTAGYFNCIWQGDANEMILRALPLAASPPAAFNLTCPDILSVREVATNFSKLFDRPARFVGAEADTALLSNTERLREELGPPATSLDTIIRWTAHWVQNGGRFLNKPTHFDVRNGQY